MNQFRAVTHVVLFFSSQSPQYGVGSCLSFFILLQYFAANCLVVLPANQLKYRFRVFFFHLSKKTSATQQCVTSVIPYLRCVKHISKRTLRTTLTKSIVFTMCYLQIIIHRNISHAMDMCIYRHKMCGVGGNNSTMEYVTADAAADSSIVATNTVQTCTQIACCITKSKMFLSC